MPASTGEEMSTNQIVEVSDEYGDAIDREWARLANPSSFFTGAQRVALAEEARRQRNGDPTPTGAVDGVAAEAARLIATRAKDARAEWVDGLEQRGLMRYAYVEVIGLVARLEAVDVFEFALGRPLRPLPKPVPGDPTGIVDPAASMQGAWVPTTDVPNAPVSLSAIPNESRALHDIHGSFFITNEQIIQFDLVKDLIRPQMEIVAARASMLNECFY